MTNKAKSSFVAIKDAPGSFTEYPVPPTETTGSVSAAAPSLYAVAIANLDGEISSLHAALNNLEESLYAALHAAIPGPPSEATDVSEVPLVGRIELATGSVIAARSRINHLIHRLGI